MSDVSEQAWGHGRRAIALQLPLVCRDVLKYGRRLVKVAGSLLEYEALAAVEGFF